MVVGQNPQPLTRPTGAREGVSTKVIMGLLAYKAAVLGLALFYAVALPGAFSLDGFHANFHRNAQPDLVRKIHHLGWRALPVSQPAWISRRLGFRRVLPAVARSDPGGHRTDTMPLMGRGSCTGKRAFFGRLDTFSSVGRRDTWSADSQLRSGAVAGVSRVAVFPVCLFGGALAVTHRGFLSRAFTQDLLAGGGGPLPAAADARRLFGLVTVFSTGVATYAAARLAKPAALKSPACCFCRCLPSSPSIRC